MDRRNFIRGLGAGIAAAMLPFCAPVEWSLRKPKVRERAAYADVYEAIYRANQPRLNLDVLIAEAYQINLARNLERDRDWELTLTR